ncbi:unnamed protein product, partial [Phaeothamnion confervicola]
VNERLVHTKADMLLFSRRARPLECGFRPYTLRDYRRRQPAKGAYLELGRLPPDLDTDELVAKRANIDRIKEFSKNLREINKRQQGQTPPHRRTEPAPEPCARERALAFAKTLPRQATSTAAS